MTNKEARDHALAVGAEAEQRRLADARAEADRSKCSDCKDLERRVAELEAKLADVREAALEEAAQMADQIGKESQTVYCHPGGDGEDRGASDGAWEVAVEIRAAKGKK